MDSYMGAIPPVDIAVRVSYTIDVEYLSKNFMYQILPIMPA